MSDPIGDAWRTRAASSGEIPLLDSKGQHIGHVENIHRGEQGETVADLVFDDINKTPVDEVMRSFFQVPINVKIVSEA